MLSVLTREREAGVVELQKQAIVSNKRSNHKWLEFAFITSRNLCSAAPPSSGWKPEHALQIAVHFPISPPKMKEWTSTIWLSYCLYDVYLTRRADVAFL